ncbi:MAG: PhnD/SsuA/transferrin family substrate-binding protein [Gammaproteobacteria bacterium]|nr:PhnD/SsuA/transferrin family substrate-binding protein [Gammaproteobacteria bacterium]
MRTRLAAAGSTRLPDVLEHEPELPQAWLDPGLLLSQTCGYPLVTALAGRVRLVATPCYCAGGCEGARYRSWLVGRRADGAAALADFQGRTVVINSSDSLSGCKVLEMLVGDLGAFFGAVRTSGGHANSLVMVRAGAADLAAIDCVTWALLERHRPLALEGLAIVGGRTVAAGSSVHHVACDHRRGTRHPSRSPAGSGRRKAARGGAASADRGFRGRLVGRVPGDPRTARAIATTPPTGNSRIR